MTAKDVRFEEESRARLLQGMETLAEAVRVTMGPLGRNVVLDKAPGLPRSTKDGVTVARDIELADRFENMGAQMLREVAGKANEEAGDGTTTAIVLAQAIAHEAAKGVAAGLDPMEIRRGIEVAVAAADQHIGRMSRPVETRDDMARVGFVASNGDDEIADLLADAFQRVGADGVVTVEEGQSLETELDITEGMKFDNGYLSPHFVTNQEKLICELEQPRILLHEGKISTLRPLLPILESVAQSGAPLLIVAEDVEGEALATLVVNKLRGGLKVTAVKAPGFGDRRKALMDDLAAITGATVVREELGIDLEKAGAMVLGTARRVTSTKDDTVIVGTDGRDDAVAERTALIRAELSESTSDYDREQLERRLAALSGGVAVLRIGGTSEARVKERKDRADDALNAVRAAVAEGIVPGGGVALLDAGEAIELPPSEQRERLLAAHAVQRALEAPLCQIVENAGHPGTWTASRLREREDDRLGFDARSGEIVDMLGAGIIDPVRVVRAALRSGGSVAGLLVTTEASVADHVEEEEEEGETVDA